MRCVLPVIALLVLGCSSGPATPAGDANVCTRVQLWSEACSMCIATNCCTETVACKADADCQQFLACGAACAQDGLCLIDCANAHNAGPARDLRICLTNACASLCS